MYPKLSGHSVHTTKASKSLEDGPLDSVQVLGCCTGLVRVLVAGSRSNEYVKVRYQSNGCNKVPVGRQQDVSPSKSVMIRHERGLFYKN